MDVAQRADVSYQTVSRVINNHHSVSDETRARVQQAIKELDYRPNRAAQSLAGTKSRTLAMTTYGLGNYGPAQMVINIEEACRDAGYDLIFTNVNDQHLANLKGAIDYLRRWDVDGLLLISPVEGLSYDELVALCGNIPLVLIGTRLGFDVPSVVMDQKLGTRLLTEHLIGLGHRHFCAITGPMLWFDAQERHESWLEALNKAGLTPGASAEGTWTAESGYQAARTLLSRGERFTALMCGNDQMALGAISALREANLRVPEDVSVVGFDDYPEAAFCNPPLTTVRQEWGLLGRRGIESLIERMRQPNAPSQQIVIEPKLVIRASTSAPSF